MTQILGSKSVIVVPEIARCQLCGIFAELRPYGPNKEHICIQCAKKDIKTTERMMRLTLLNQNIH